jgi:hypothetical protein
MMKAKSYYHNELMANRGSGVIKLLPRFWKTKSFCGSGLIQSVKTGARFSGRDTQKGIKRETTRLAATAGATASVPSLLIRMSVSVPRKRHRRFQMKEVLSYSTDGGRSSGIDFQEWVPNHHKLL